MAGRDMKKAEEVMQADTAFQRVLVEGYKVDMMAFMDAQPEAFEEAVALAPTDRGRFAWRSAWLVADRMADNDPRVRPAIDALIAAAPERADGHQRELIKILLRMELDDEQEGRLFDLAMTLWENVDKKPAVRWFAFRFILKMVTKYPDLKAEVAPLTQSAYVKPLSPGVRRSVGRLIAEAFGRV